MLISVTLPLIVSSVVMRSLAAARVTGQCRRHQGQRGIEGERHVGQTGNVSRHVRGLHVQRVLAIGQLATCRPFHRRRIEDKRAVHFEGRRDIGVLLRAGRIEARLQSRDRRYRGGDAVTWPAVVSSASIRRWRSCPCRGSGPRVTLGRVVTKVKDRLATADTLPAASMASTCSTCARRPARRPLLAPSGPA